MTAPKEDPLDRVALDATRAELESHLADVPEDDAARATLAWVLVIGYETSRQSGDLDVAVAHLTAVLEREFASDWRAEATRCLGIALVHRWEFRHDRADLDAAVHHLGGDLSDPAVALLHARLLHESAMLDRDPARLALAIEHLARAGDRLSAGPGLQALVELGTAHWNRFILTQDCGALAAAAEVFGEALEAPDVDDDEREALRGLRALALVMGGERAGESPAEARARAEEVRAVFVAILGAFYTGRAFTGDSGLPAEMRMPARFASILDPDVIAREHETVHARYEGMPADDPGRPVASLLIGMIGIMGRMMGVGPQDPPEASVRAAEEAYATTTTPELQRLAQAILAITLFERGTRDGTPDDFDAAIEHVRSMLAQPAADDDPLRPHLPKLVAGALHNRYRVRGDLHDLEASVELLRGAAADEGVPEIERLLMRASLAEALETWAARTADPVAAERAVEELADVLSQLPIDHPGRRESAVNLAVLRGKRQLARLDVAGGADPADIDALIAEAHLPGLDDAVRAEHLLAVAITLTTSSAQDPAALQAAAAYARQAAHMVSEDSTAFPRLVVHVAVVLQVLYEIEGDLAHIEEAVQWLSWGARSAAEPSHPDFAIVRHVLAQMRRLPQTREGREASRRLGVQALRGNRWRVLLQSTVDHATLTASEAVEDAMIVATWCINDDDATLAVNALDAARGAVLHAATAVADVPAMLLARGEEGLATRWRAAPAADPDLRYEVMKALSSTEHLLDPPDVATVQHVLRTTGTDALVYLLASGSRPAGGAAVIVPASGFPQILRLALADRPGGHLDRYTAAYGSYLDGAPGARGRWRTALEDLLDWAGVTTIRPLLARLGGHRSPRVVLVPMGRLGLVPWHAARVGNDYALHQATWSYAASARLFVEVAARPPVAPDAGVLVVGDPNHELRFAGREACAIHEAFYPDGRYLGQPPSRSDGPGVPAEVLAWLAGGDRYLLHLACHGIVDEGRADTSYLRLAGGQRLTAEELIELSGARGVPGRLGIVSLAACTTSLSTRGYDEAFSLATAFLVAGAQSAFGSLWRVQDATTSLLMFMTHYFLCRERVAPAEALRRAQLWMVDPRRTPVPEMPSDLLAFADTPDLAEPTAWAGFTHLGV